MTMSPDPKSEDKSRTNATADDSLAKLSHTLPPRIFGQLTRLLEWHQTVRYLAKMAVWVFGLWQATEAVKVFAGQETSVSLLVQFLSDTPAGVTISLSIFLTIGVGGWAIMERNLRFRKVRGMEARLKAYERSIDPNRSSSGLTAEGKTHPRDRD